MSDEQTIDVLNHLLEAECGSLIPRLGEAAPFVAWPAAQQRPLVQRMVADHEAHERDLCEMIIRLRGAPVTPRRSMATGGMHYIDLIHLLPDIVAGIRKLVETYESAAGGDNAEANGLIARILEDHKRHLADWEKLASDMARPTGRHNETAAPL